MCFLCSIMKNVLGKDVTKIALPVHLNEPLSFCQVGTVMLAALCSPHQGITHPFDVGSILQCGNMSRLGGHTPRVEGGRGGVEREVFNFPYSSLFQSFWIEILRLELFRNIATKCNPMLCPQCPGHWTWTTGIKTIQEYSTLAKQRGENVNWMIQCCILNSNGLVWSITQTTVL